MADDDKADGGISGPMQQFAAQVRRMTADLQTLTGLGGPGAEKAPPLPGAFSAREMTTIATHIAAQRRSIQALQAQLTAFDDQLAVLETILGPLAEWSSRWAELEDLMMNMGRPPRPEA